MKVNFCAEVVKYIYRNFPDKYNFTHPNQKYTLEFIIEQLFIILTSGQSFHSYPKIGKTLNRHMNFFSKNNVFKNVYIELLEKYFKSNRTDKLKYQSVDSSFIPNLYASNLGRNKFYKGKRGLKISVITDLNGIPISVLIANGSKHDAKLFHENLNLFLISTNVDKYKNHNRYKQYLLADKGYCSKKIRSKCKKLGYNFICPFNKRNTKDENKIIHLTEDEKDIYKKRIIVENLFSWLKKNKRLQFVYEKSFEVFLSFVFMGLIKILHKRLCN